MNIPFWKITCLCPIGPFLNQKFYACFLRRYPLALHYNAFHARQLLRKLDIARAGFYVQGGMKLYLLPGK